MKKGRRSREGRPFDFHIPRTVTLGGVKSLIPNFGQSHLRSNLAFDTVRMHFGSVLKAYPGKLTYLTLGAQSASAIHIVNAAQMVRMGHLLRSA
jgi:hypothetical protein